MKKIIGSIFVCSILATSAMAETNLHPEPWKVLSMGKMLSVQTLNKGRTVRFVVAFDDNIYTCRHVSYSGQNTGVWCVQSTYETGS